MVVRSAPANLLTVGQPTYKIIHGSTQFSDRNSGSFGSLTNRLRRNPGPDGNRRTWTISAWVKKSTTVPSNVNCIFSNGANSSGEGFIGFSADDKLYFGNDGHHNFVSTDRKFRDMGWYHVVWAADTTQSTADDRWKVYVNGVLIPAADYASPGITHHGAGYIQAYDTYSMWQCIADRERGHQNSGNGTYPFDGNITEFYFIDGQQLPASDFGFTDPLTNTWKPKKINSLPTQINNGTTWSNYTTSSTGSYHPSGAAVNLFDANLNTAIDASTSSGYIEWTPPSVISYTSNLQVYHHASDVDFLITHGDDSTTTISIGSGNTQWHTLMVGSGTIKKIRCTPTSNNYVNWRAIKIDGIIMKDSTTDNNITDWYGPNGFYLPMDGKYPIGKDLSGNGNDFTTIVNSHPGLAGSTIKDATGALPILNTFDDGRRATCGVRGSNANVGYAVTVHNDGGGNKYYIDGVKQKTLTGLTRGTTYTFDVSDTSTIGHPLRLAPVDKHTNTDWYSVDFDGTGDYLSIDTTGTELNFGTGEFTIEGWFYFDSSATPNNGLFQICGDTGGLSASANTLSINLETSGGRTYQLYGASTGGWRTGGNDHEFLPFKWNHVAEVRSSGTITIYINGRPSQSWSDTTTYNYDAAAVGGYYTTGYLWNGYISNFRIVKGTALYTSEFTPSAVPLTNITGTELLCCQQSTVTNAAVTPAAITSNGDPSSSTKSPFIYDTNNGVSSNGFPIGTYAVDFDGNDYLRVPASTDISSFNGDFTCECFFNVRSYNDENGLLIGSWNHTDGRRVWQIRIMEHGRLDWYVSYDGTTGNGNNLESAVGFIETGRWYHVAVERYGNVLTLYLDGISCLSHAMTSATYNNTQDGVDIGGTSYGTKHIDGMVSNFRIVKGSAVYKGNFIPKGPLTNITNTTLLCCNGSSVTDATVIPTGSITSSGDPSSVNLTTTDSVDGHTKITIPYNAPDTLYYYCDAHSGMGSSITNITTGLPSEVDQYASNCVVAIPMIGNANSNRADEISDQINCTSRRKEFDIFGNVSTREVHPNFYGSCYGFDGTGDYLLRPDHNDIELEGDFTIECWAYRNSATHDDAFWGIGDSKESTGLELYYGTSGSVIKLYSDNGAYLTSPDSQSGGMWNHYAVVRKGPTISIYVNGSFHCSETGTSEAVARYGTGTNGYVNVGRGIYNGNPDNPIDGFMQDFRIYNGVAKYTEDFLPPSTGYNAGSISPTSVPFGSQIKNRYSSDLLSGSVWFDGSKNRMRCADTTELDPASTWTLEAWIWKQETCGADGNARAIISKWDNTGGNNDKGWYLRIQDSTDNRLSFLWTEDGSTNKELLGKVTIGNKKWYHVAVVANNGYLTMYVDGVQDHTTPSGYYSTIREATVPIFIGGVHIPSNTQQWKGYLSNVRFVAGTALYTSDFTPPTKPLTNISGTKLLCCQSTKESTEAISPKTLQYTGKKVANTGATVDSDDPFSSGELGSVSFDGSNDYMKVNDSGTDSDFDFGTGDFTIELWINISSTHGTNPVLIGAVGGWYIQLKSSDSVISIYNGSTEYTHTGSSLSTGSWHHIAASREGTALKVYVDGTKRIDETNSENFNLAADLYLGSFGGSSLYFGGKISHARVIKGKALYTGSSITVPTSPIEPTPETVLLCCSDNYWVDTSYDSTKTNLRTFNPFNNTSGRLDSDYCTWNNIDKLSSNVTLQDGNLNWSCTNSDGGNARGTVVMTSGKYYWEVKTQVGNRFHTGVSRIDMNLPAGDAGNTNTEWVFRTDGYKVHNNSESQIGDDIKSSGNIVMIAYNADDGEIYFGGNGVWFDFADPSRRLNPAYTNATPGTHGMAPSIGRRTSNCGGIGNFGQRPFVYQPPEGYRPLTVANALETDIVRPDQYFSTNTFTIPNNGSGGKLILDHDFDLIWTKNRSNNSTNHIWQDNVIGYGDQRNLHLNLQNDLGSTNNITSVKGREITIGSNSNYYDNNVAFAWKAGGTNETTFWGSVKLDGSDDALTTANSSDFDFGSGDFTVEAWMKPTNATQIDPVVVSLWNYPDSRRSWAIFGDTGGAPGTYTGTIRGVVSPDGAWATRTEISGTCTVNSWNHVAFVRNGNTLNFFVNGVSQGTASYTGSVYNNTSDGIMIGGMGDDAPDIRNDWNGLISNVRVVKGTAVYTSNFTVPTSPLTPITNTKLLCCQDYNRKTSFTVSPGNITSHGGLFGDPESPFTKKRFQVDGVGYTSAASAGMNGGDITPTGCSVGTRQGFSIVKYSGNGTNNQTLSHGLGRVPAFCIVKNLTSDNYWIAKHANSGTGDVVYPNSNEAEGPATGSQHGVVDELNNSTTVNLKTNATNYLNCNASGDDYIMYTWANIPGLQRFGVYTGNNSITGRFVYLGFRPSLVIIKRADTADSWMVMNSKCSDRIGFNPIDKHLRCDGSNDEEDPGGSPAVEIDFLHNGFKNRQTNGQVNANDGKYLYMAWAETPEFNLFGSQSNGR